jgi:hypothetical protein
LLAISDAPRPRDDRLSRFFSDVIALPQNGECPAGLATGVESEHQLGAWPS